MPLKKTHAFRGGLASWLFFWCVMLAAIGPCAGAVPDGDTFQQGFKEFLAGHFPEAAGLFREAALAAPSAGAWHNLGNVEWKSGNPGPAILAWERAEWLDPFARNPASNLRYARKARQLDAPELGWAEICSSWLQANWWPWLACLSFWLAVAMMMLPGIFGWRKAGWQQGLAAACFAIFLLTIPALVGIHTRTALGIILPADTPLRLTPTEDAQTLARLPAGESARLERTHGAYVYIRTSSAAGWVEKAQFGLIASGKPDAS